jgi:hypothetical protein
MIWRSWNLCIAESDQACFFGRSWQEFEEEEVEDDDDDSDDYEDDEDMSEFETCVDLNMCQVMQTKHASELSQESTQTLEFHVPKTE